MVPGRGRGAAVQWYDSTVTHQVDVHNAGADLVTKGEGREAVKGPVEGEALERSWKCSPGRKDG
jgi:hypothetical protein